MAREQLRSHLSGSVPVSIGVHLVVLLVLVVIPLVNVVVPTPLKTMDSFVLAAPLPPPPSLPPPRPVVSPASPRTSEAVPVSAPETIGPEPPSAAPFTPIGAVDTGLPPGVGVPESVGPPVAVPAPPPEFPRSQTGPVRAAQLPEMPRKIVDVHPVYPEVARLARVEGTVVLEAVLDTSGTVTQLRVLRSVPLLDQAALTAVRQWRYTP